MEPGEITESVFTSTMLGKDVLCHKFVGIDEAPVVGKQLAALWSYKSDWSHVDRYYRLLQHYSKAIRSCITWNPFRAEQIQNMKNKVINDFELNFENYFQDRKSGLKWFSSGYRFEPHDLLIQGNKVTWQGLSHFLRIASGQTSIYFDWMGIGKGTATYIPFNRQTLYNQVSRVSARQFGDVNTDGNVFKVSAPFPTSVPTDDITEYGGFTKITGGIMLFIAMAARALHQILNETFVQATHHIIFVSRTL